MVLFGKFIYRLVFMKLLIQTELKLLKQPPYDSKRRPVPCSGTCVDRYNDDEDSEFIVYSCEIGFFR